MSVALQELGKGPVRTGATTPWGDERPERLPPTLTVLRKLGTLRQLTAIDVTLYVNGKPLMWDLGRIRVQRVFSYRLAPLLRFSDGLWAPGKPRDQTPVKTNQPTKDSG